LLVTSHNMVEVERLCDRVVFVSGGRVVADGTPDEVATRFGRDDLEGVFLHLADGHIVGGIDQSAMDDVAAAIKGAVK